MSVKDQLEKAVTRWPRPGTASEPRPLVLLKPSAQGNTGSDGVYILPEPQIEGDNSLKPTTELAEVTLSARARSLAGSGRVAVAGVWAASSLTSFSWVRRHLYSDSR